jgi:ketosteroid isomerase-like protein
MKRAGKSTVIAAGVLALSAPFGAGAQEFTVACAKAGDQRTIRIVSPGEVGRLCDVRYERDGGGAEVPYYADNSAAYCKMKAEDLAATLTESGYDCAPLEGEVVAEVTSFREPPLSNTPPAPAPAAPPPLPDDPPADIPAPREAAPGEAADAAPEDTSLEERMRAILEAPVAPPANETELRGPALLTPKAPSFSGAAGAPGPTASVGKLVGAAPETVPPQDSPPALERAPPQRALAPTPAGTAAPSPEAAPSSPAPVAASEASADRSPEDVIRATLRAQAAAWNEGNLDAFMDIYWKSDELKFVSGAEIAKGWTSVMKLHRQRYADETGLGWRVFDKIDVIMVGEDIAVVTGNYSLTKGDNASSGVFSIVMRRIQGVWRIIHDHASAGVIAGGE